MVFVFKKTPDKSVTLSGNWHTNVSTLPLNTQLKFKSVYNDTAHNWSFEQTL